MLMNNNSMGRTLEEWKLKHPLLADLVSAQEVFWTNPGYKPSNNPVPIKETEIQEAETRLIRFAPYIAQAFPETQRTGGFIESPLIPIPNMQGYLGKRYNIEIPGHLWLKCDSHLPISGSIKARGGIYEVLKHAERLALAHGLLKLDDDCCLKFFEV